MTNTFAALQQQESQAALASAADASASQNKSGVDFRHAPVAASVQVVTSHIKSHPRVRSTLTTLQSYLPALVTEKAIAGAGQLQALTLEYGTPLVARVDGKLSNAIETLLAAPATSLEYGAKKLSAVDQFAFAHTPAALQPAYTSARTFTIEKATIAGHKVVELKKARAEPLWERLTSGLDQIRAQLAAVRSAITNAPSNAFASLHLVDRLNQLQAKLHGAIEAAQAKGTQARALANDLIASFSEAAVAFEGYLESRFLTKDQAAWIHSLWSQLLTQANNLKGAVLGSASPASSRRSSSASETSVASFATDVEDSPVSVGAPVTAAASASTSAGTDRAHAVEPSKPSYASVFPNLATPADSGVEVAASADDTTGLSPLPADVDAEPTTTASTSSGAQKRKNKAGKNKATGSQQPHDL